MKIQEKQSLGEMTKRKAANINESHYQETEFNNMCEKDLERKSALELDKEQRTGKCGL